MTGEEFLRQLETMLADVTEEERREALRYYEEYLRDAGADQEQQVLAELGSPARVAAIIRANVPGSRAQPHSAPAPGPEPLRIRGLAPDGVRAGTGAAAAAQPAPAGTGRTALWWILLLVTSPLWLSLLAVVVSALAGVVGLFVGLACVLLAVVLAGIICVFAGGRRICASGRRLGGLRPGTAGAVPGTGPGFRRGGQGAGQRLGLPAPGGERRGLICAV